MEMKIYEPYQPPPRLVKHSDFYLFLEKVQSAELPFFGKIINAYLPYVSEIRTVTIISSISDACTITVYDGEQNVEISLICCGPIISADELKIFQNQIFTHSETISLLMNNRNKNLWTLSEIEMFIRIKRIFGQDLEKIFEEIIKLNNNFAKSYLQVNTLNFEYFSTIPGNSENKASKLEKSSQYNQLSVHHEKVAQRLINVYKQSENLIRKKYLKMDLTYESILSTNFSTKSRMMMTTTTTIPLMINSSSLTTFNIDENLNITHDDRVLNTDITSNSQGGVGEGFDRNKRHRGIYVEEEPPTKHHRNLGTRLDHFKEMYGQDLSKLTSSKSCNSLDEKKKYKSDGSNNIVSDTTNGLKTSEISVELDGPPPPPPPTDIITTTDSERNNKMVLGLDEKLLCKLSRLLELLKESKKYEVDNNTILIGNESKFYLKKSNKNGKPLETKPSSLTVSKDRVSATSTSMTSSSSSFCGGSSYPGTTQTSDIKCIGKRKSSLDFNQLDDSSSNHTTTYPLTLPSPPSSKLLLPLHHSHHHHPPPTTWEIESTSVCSLQLQQQPPQLPIRSIWQPSPLPPSNTSSTSSSSLGRLYLSHSTEETEEDFMNCTNVTNVPCEPL